MAKLETYTITRQDLRRILIAFGMSEKNIEPILASMEKAHRHINVVVFASLLERSGLERDKIMNVLRRFGMDDVSIRLVLDIADEQKILSETGRLFDVSVDYG
ncbi:MAG: hypothetical protein M1504_01080 [Candidatus Marsarchaeota archaeon]|nr:hypothetical protein [Candidatus Marsarchaeota archaeon]